MWSAVFWTEEIQIGQIRFSPLSLILGLILLLVLMLFQRLIRKFLAHRLFPRFRMNAGLSNAYATLIGYTVLFLGLTLILPLTFQGFNWGTLSVMVGAASIGVGFGLRTIADNFVSGLIILIERPIKVGDRITVDNTSGRVYDIRARSTTVATNDNIEVIVPNARFISETVINWSHRDNKVRFRIPVGVHYKSDVFHVRDVLERAVLQNEHVLRDPPPSAKFIEFGDSSLNFEVWVWTYEKTHTPSSFRSELNYLIWQALKEENIEIPYPQRDVYIKEQPDNVGRRGAGLA